MKAHILALTFVMTAGAALAQPGGGPHGHDGGRHLEKMQQELGLTDEQMQEIRKIYREGGSREDISAVMTDEQWQRAVELRQERWASRAERRERLREKLDLTDEQVEQIEEIHHSGGSRQDIRAILTEEQQQQWDEIRSQHRGKKRSRD